MAQERPLPIRADVRSSRSQSGETLPHLELVGDRVGDNHLSVETMKQLDLVEKSEVVQRPAVGDDDHRLGRIPSSRMHRQIVFKIRCRVPERHLMLLEQGMHLETGLEPQQTADLAFGQRAGAIGLHGNGFK